VEDRATEPVKRKRTHLHVLTIILGRCTTRHVPAQSRSVASSTCDFLIRRLSYTKPRCDTRSSAVSRPRPAVPTHTYQSEIDNLFLPVPDPGLLSFAATMLNSSDDYRYNLGSYHRKVSTGNDKAQAWFDRGLIWSYAFHHEESVRCFQSAINHDAKCAMAYWGVS
jgi:hypothetical protein